MRKTLALSLAPALRHLRAMTGLLRRSDVSVVPDWYAQRLGSVLGGNDGSLQIGVGRFGGAG